MGKFDGKVALITGGARGQGRCHAEMLAREGADIAICDIAAQVDTVPYQMGTMDELHETEKRVKDLGRKCLAVQADTRDFGQMQQLADRVLSKFGKIDILLANAGIFSMGQILELDQKTWQDMIDTNLTGTFNTLRAVVPHMVKRKYGRVVATASMAGREGFPYIGHYAAAKWGVIGLVKTLALEVANKGVTVNAVCPTNVDTPMIQNEAAYRLFVPGKEHPSREEASKAASQYNGMPIPWVEPQDVTNAIMFLVSDEARYMSGVALPVSAGLIAKNAA